MGEVGDRLHTTPSNRTGYAHHCKDTCVRLRGNQALGPPLETSVEHCAQNSWGPGWGLGPEKLKSSFALRFFGALCGNWGSLSTQHLLGSSWQPEPPSLIWGETLMAPCCKGPLKANTKQGEQAVDGVSNSSGSPLRGRMYRQGQKLQVMTPWLPLGRSKVENGSQC